VIKAKNIILGVALATATTFGAMASTAIAAPFSAPVGVAEQSAADTVNYRGGRYHCHWQRGVKRCHGQAYRGNGPRYGYYNRHRSPGITLRFGSDNRGYRNRRWR
jgi:hypothetical protein